MNTQIIQIILHSSYKRNKWYCSIVHGYIKIRLSNTKRDVVQQYLIVNDYSVKMNNMYSTSLQISSLYQHWPGSKRSSNTCDIV